MNTLPATRFPQGLYGITPEWNDEGRLIAAVEQAAEGGMRALQWRRKHLAADQHRPQACTLAQVCSRLGVLFIVNDDVELALDINADGVHLGRDDGPLRAARAALGPTKILGCSCYDSPALARQALNADVDYVAFGAMYPSDVKPDAVRASLEVVRQGRDIVQAHGGAGPRPAVVAIGGLTAHNALPVIQAGADSIALINGLFQTSDVRAAAQQCSVLFTG